MTLCLIGDAQDFDGLGGDVLSSSLRAAGISRSDAHCVRFAPETIAAALHSMKPAPTVIVGFGEAVCARLVGDAWPPDGIQACRGYLWDTPYGRVLSAMAPARIVSEWVPWRALLDFDLRRARAEVEAGAPPLTTRIVHIVTQPSELAPLYAAIRRESSAAQPLSVDIENTHDLTLACCGFAPTPAEAWVIPANEDWQLDAIKALCESDVPKVLQNGQYDRFFLKRFARIALRNHTRDSMLQWHSVNPELAGKKTDVGYKKAKARRTAKSLKFLASLYTRDPWWKAYDFANEYERYMLCGRDVCITSEIALKLATQLDAMALTPIHDFELALLDPYLAMLERGIRIDDERRRSMLIDIASERLLKASEAQLYVTHTILPTYADRLTEDKRHLFHERRVCACCRNGKAKRAACWACAGLDKKPSATRAAAAGITLAPCAKCAGAGAFTVAGFNPASPNQLKVVLYDLLRLPARTKDGKLTTEAKALKSLLAEAKPDAVVFLRTLLRVTKLDSIAEILTRIAPGPDGKIHSAYNPAATETGRPASSETFLMPASTNLNNLPKKEVTEPLFDVRAVCIPDPGMVFIEADFSGAEQWVTSCCAGDEAFLDVLRSGVKVHRWTAARILKKPEAEVTELEYSLYKTARHALNYGMQWKTFMENVNFVADRTGVAITARQSKEVYAGFHALHPKLENVWWKRVMAQLGGGVMTTCFGRRRTFYGRNRGEWLGETHREAIANEPQSTIGDLTNRGLLRWWRQHDGKIGELLAQVYDSMLLQAPRAKAQLCADLVRRCMTEEIEVHGIRITIPVDVKICESWAVLKEAA